MPDDDPQETGPDQSEGGPGGDTHARNLPPWLVPLLIGLVTITAGVFTWRAGQLGSSAAFEDRQSVGQTIKQQQERVEAGLATVNQTVAYVDYAADFASAAALDSLGEEVAAQDLPDASTTLSQEADSLRSSATERALAAGVFGEQAVLEQTVIAPDDPIPFDLDAQLRANQAGVGTGIASPGVLDPDKWAADAEATRERVRTLRLDTFLLLISVVAYTVAELAPRRLTRRIGFAIGTVVYVYVTVITFAGSF